VSVYIETSRPFGRRAQPTSLETLRVLPVEIAVKRSLMALSNLGRLATRIGHAVGDLRTHWSTGGRL
jgi:hypothetical protein